MTRMKPLTIEDCKDDELKKTLEHFVTTLGFVPNSILTMLRVPVLTKAFIELNKAVFAKDSKVDLGFKRLVGHMASHASGCMYCKAHTSVSASRLGIDEDKMQAIYEYSTSPLFSDKERVALEYALSAASVPNGVTDELYEKMTTHWSEEEIVEILGVISMFGFLNRWNDSMATPLEDEPLTLATNLIGSKGWSPGKHVN